MAKYVVLDSGFWYAFYDARDEHHKDATLLADYLMVHKLIIPWPSLYETLNTRFVRRLEWLVSFSRHLRQPNVIKLEDEPYREQALISVLEASRTRRYSLVDTVIREVLQDTSIRIDAIVTFNEQDFIDVCSRRNIEVFAG